MKRKLRIYIAGPYTAVETAEIEANTNRAIDAGIALLKRGHIPFIPHLTHFVDMRARQLSVAISWDEYISWDQAWLDQCDALLYLGPSRGADIELERARALGKSIFYDLEAIPSIGSATTPIQELARQK